MTDKDDSEIIGEAIIADLSEMFYKQINEDGVSPLVIVRSLLTVAANVSAQQLGLKSTAAIFRTFATLADEKFSKLTN